MTEQPSKEQLQGALAALTQCMWCVRGHHYPRPTWHSWGNSSDYAAAHEASLPAPDRCGCWCAEGDEEDR